MSMSFLIKKKSVCVCVKDRDRYKFTDRHTCMRMCSLVQEAYAGKP